MKKAFFTCCFFLFFTFSFFSEGAILDSGKTEKVSYKNLGFPGMQKEKVCTLRKKYLTTHSEWLKNLLDDALEYRIFVRTEIEKRGLPEILEYLPVVESNYMPLAKSRSGATGMWQFMLNSISPFLICNEYVDERLDPWKSTEAALSKLTDNYKMFGDWLLAITAYNCGAGALKRAIKKAGKSDFWYLVENGFLSEQASSYVPKLLAIYDVVENDEYYGVTMPHARAWNGKTLEIRSGAFDYVTVHREISIIKLARELRIDEEELLRLNSSLVKKVTPPKAEYKIRLPERMGSTALIVLENM